MRSLLLHRAPCSACPARAVAKPAAAAAVARQQHTAGWQRQAARQRHVVARVRIDELENSVQGQPRAAAEALQAYMQLEQSGEFNSVTAGNLRLKYGMRRGDDGRVQLRKEDGTWMQLKLDMEVRGTMLLRNTADDTIWVLQTEMLEQIDLSDDYMLFSLFADKGWEQQIVPIQLTDESGSPSILEMNAQQFKDYVGLLKVLQEAEQMAVEQQQDDGPIDVTAEAAPTNGNKQ